MAPGRAAVFAALLLWITSGIALAQDVTLTSRDGGIALSGTLLGFDGDFYRIDTIYGELTLDGDAVSCAGPGCPDLKAYVADIALSGSAVMGSVMMPALVEAFARQEGHAVSRADVDASHYTMTLRDAEAGREIAVFRFRVTTTDEGFADLLANEADIVMALREIRPAEVARARDAGLGDLTEANRHRVVALDALVPVVATGNTVRSVSPRDLARVFAGRITNWSVLGGPEGPITLYAPAAGSGSGQAVKDKIMAPAGADLAAHTETSDQGTDLSAAVASDPSGIGLARFSQSGSAQPLVLSGPCGRMLTAARHTIKPDEYPFTVPMFLYLPALRLPAPGRDFLQFLSTPAAQLVIRRAGLVDLAPEEIPPEAQGIRFANAILAGEDVSLADLQKMARTLAPMSRLTTSFRFDPDTAEPDAQSRAHLVQLAQALTRGQYVGRTLLFAGFSAGTDADSEEQPTDLRRAEMIVASVLGNTDETARDRVTLRTAAFGAAMPLACEDTPRGRTVNRRVEVWVR